MGRTKVGQMALCFSFIIMGFIATAALLLDFNKPHYYDVLFLMPLVFSLLSFVFYQIYFLIPSNLGVSLIVCLSFWRMVITPLFMSLGDYSVVLQYNLSANTDKAVFLICYEMMAIFIALYVLCRRSNKQKDGSVVLRGNAKISKIYVLLLIFILVILAFCISTTPELLEGYRTVFEISEQFFVNHEDAYIVEQYGKDFISKLSLVLGQYFMRAAVIIVPAFLIILLLRKQSVSPVAKILSFLMCLLPLFFIGGAIARSLIYCVELFLLRSYMTPSKRTNKRMAFLILVAAVLVIIWWLFRLDVNGGVDNVFAYFSETFNSYFSGVNIVSGVFNMPNDFEIKLHYFIYDYIGSVPFGNTLFGLTGDRIQPFFNAFNGTTGQIPTTIGMGYYYFGYLLAPLYSILFACIAFKASEKVQQCNTQTPVRYIRLLVMIFSFSMGIIMYNIEILFTNVFSLILPMYIMERISYKKEVHE
ncbi:MAG: oligosaccharide repeat unit polymerase [Clostridia bacterium]|nr:oligosaccharide repeat unit polymerase [Clostridia bacterium]